MNPLVAIPRLYLTHKAQTVLRQCTVRDYSRVTAFTDVRLTGQKVGLPVKCWIGAALRSRFGFLPKCPETYAARTHNPLERQMLFFYLRESLKAAKPAK